MNISSDDGIVAALGAPPVADSAVLRQLHDRLADAAFGEGLLDISYRTIDTPVGSLLLASTAVGLLRVAFERENHDTVLESLATQISPRVLRAPARLDAAATQVEQYFAGTRTAFDLPLDRALSRGFRGEVQALLPSITYGQTCSYADLARFAGNPRAVRAAASACAMNPLPIIVPCHRVVRSDGSLGGYVGGPDAKTVLLALESVA